MSAAGAGRRRWYSGVQAVAGASLGVFSNLRARRLGGLIPVMVALYLAAILLYFINLVSPLAPFVYSLF